MATNIGVLAVDAFTLAKTFDPQVGIALQFTCRAPSGMKGPLPAIWLDLAGARQLQKDLAALLRQIDTDPRAKHAARPPQ